MGQKKITFYVDIISPFGYLGYWMLRNSALFKDVEVTYIPILLGGLHKQCGIQPPIMFKNKVDWINVERTRFAELFSIPLRQSTPPGFPFSTVNVMRALTALHMELDAGASAEGMAKFAEVVDLCWAVVWSPQSDALTASSGKAAVEKLKDANGEIDPKSPEKIRGLFAIVVGEEMAEKCLKRTADKDVKDQLLKNTGGAFDAGAFGIPWFACTNEKGEKDGFWGFDHLGFVVRFLGLEETGDKARSGQLVRALL